mgnify:CR=1 FL=1
MYGLEILAANINYNGNNYHAFIIIANEAEHSADADKITLVIAVKHEPGSLYRVLGYFYHSGLNLTNLESRPIEVSRGNIFSILIWWATLPIPMCRKQCVC